MLVTFVFTYFSNQSVRQFVGLLTDYWVSASEKAVWVEEEEVQRTVCVTAIMWMCFHMKHVFICTSQVSNGKICAPQRAVSSLALYIYVCVCVCVCVWERERESHNGTVVKCCSSCKNFFGGEGESWRYFPLLTTSSLFVKAVKTVYLRFVLLLVWVVDLFTPFFLVRSVGCV
jgi:hypothetical protein